MSIASEIEDLNTNLTAAKAAVTAKGGTVGDTGLAGLATEIASIPAGGNVPIGDYGKITILTDLALNIWDEEVNGCSASIVDERKAAAHNIYRDDPTLWFRLQDGEWVYIDEDYEGVPVTLDDILNVYGVSITNVTSNDAYVKYYADTSVNLHGGEKELTLDTLAEFNALGFSSGQTTIKGEQFTQSQLKSIITGPEVTALPDYFAYNADNLIELDLTLSENLTTVGDNCVNYCYSVGATQVSSGYFIARHITSVGDYSFNALNVPVYMPELQYVGDNCFSGLKNTDLSQFSKLISVGQFFASESRLRFVNIPATLTSMGRNSFRNTQDIRAITFPSNSALQTVGLYCFTQLPNLDTISVGKDISGCFDASDQRSFANSSAGNIISEYGIKCTGTGASALMTRFPDASGTPTQTYRKWRS